MVYLGELSKDPGQVAEEARANETRTTVVTPIVAFAESARLLHKAEEHYDLGERATLTELAKWWLELGRAVGY